MRRAARPPLFYGLAALFGLFVVFLYGPIVTIVLLAFQGPEGGLVFPMNGFSLHWFGELFRPSRSATSGEHSIARSVSARS